MGHPLERFRPQSLARGAEGFQAHFAARVGDGSEVQTQIRTRQQARGLFGPFGKLQTGRGEQVAETSVFPFLRIIEAVKVKVMNLDAACGFMGFDHRVTGALDAAFNPQSPQQMAREGGFARTQRAMQLDVDRATLAEHGAQTLGETLGHGAAVALVRPGEGVGGGGGRTCYDRHMHPELQSPLTNGPRLQADPAEVMAQLRQWATTLGFSQIGVADVDLSSAEPGLMAWLARGFHGEMHYMASHGLKRARPAELVPGTVRVITARMDYLPTSTAAEGWQAVEWARLQRPEAAAVSMYARGRDYHKVLRARLQKLADQLAALIGPLGYRVFTDSAPVLEVELASRSGVGWRGKHTLLLSREAGSTFFLGEIYVDVPLPLTEPVTAHCGACRSCMDMCPTQAIVGERQVDARRCISYLTIEHDGPIPAELRPLMGNRIYGCDDCQLACPWNKFAQRARVPDFDVRPALNDPTLLQLWQWDEATFLRLTEGSPIRRIGHARWQRNIAVAMGNALAAWRDRELTADEATSRAQMVQALQAWLDAPMVTGEAQAQVAEHVHWALAQHHAPQ